MTVSPSNAVHPHHHPARRTAGFDLGWRIAEYLEEFFAGLDAVRVAAPAGSDQAAALRGVRTESGLPLDLVEPDTSRPWDVLAYHPATGTLLEFRAVPGHDLSTVGRDAKHGTSRIPERDVSDGAHRRGGSLRAAPLELCCCIVERIVVRSRHAAAVDSPVRCRRCGQHAERSALWQDNGVLCCAGCTGLEPSWVALH